MMQPQKKIKIKNNRKKISNIYILGIFFFSVVTQMRQPKKKNKKKSKKNRKKKSVIYILVIFFFSGGNLHFELLTQLCNQFQPTHP